MSSALSTAVPRVKPAKKQHANPSAVCQPFYGIPQAQQRPLEPSWKILRVLRNRFPILQGFHAELFEGSHPFRCLDSTAIADQTAGAKGSTSSRGAGRARAQRRERECPSRELELPVFRHQPPTLGNLQRPPVRADQDQKRAQEKPFIVADRLRRQNDLSLTRPLVTSLHNLVWNVVRFSKWFQNISSWSQAPDRAAQIKGQASVVLLGVHTVRGYYFGST